MFPAKAVRQVIWGGRGRAAATLISLEIVTMGHFHLKILAILLQLGEKFHTSEFYSKVG